MTDLLIGEENESRYEASLLDMLLDNPGTDITVLAREGSLTREEVLTGKSTIKKAVNVVNGVCRGFPILIWK